MQLVSSIQNLFRQLQSLTESLTTEQYVLPSQHLSGATSGQHLRHVIELYIELNNGYTSGCVNYELRKRDRRIESDKYFAANILNQIIEELHKPDKVLALQTGTPGGHQFTVTTNYYRELLYNIDHTVHHMAMIRIGVRDVSTIQLPDHFGLSASTVQYREKIGLAQH